MVSLYKNESKCHQSEFIVEKQVFVVFLRNILLLSISLFVNLPKSRRKSSSAVNVSSPNTPGLRELQEKKPLSKILARLQEINNKKDKRKPILLKISPDLTTTQLDIIIEIVIDLKIDGIIATNTTIDRTNLLTDKSKVEKIGAGGLSGKPLNDKSNSVIKYIKERSNGSFPIIGVGGINSAEDAIGKIDAGASLVQIYTGFIYKGPSLIKNINKAILNSEVNN